MGNPQHLEWLLEGVESWNARREREDFTPDLSGTDIRKAFEGENKLDPLGFIPLEGANLWRANLGGADLVEANLRGADLVEANLREADLRGANLWRANLGGANLWRANLGGANLRGADLRGAKLRGADLRGAHVRAYVYSGAGARNGAPEYTDLSSTFFLTQEQVDVLDGDLGVILPEGLKHPDHWVEPGLSEQELADQSQENLTPQQVEAVKTRLVQNRLPLALTAAALQEQIAAYRFEVYSNNQLASERPEFRDDLLAFLDHLAASVSDVLAVVPANEVPPSDADAVKAGTWMARFSERWKNGEQYLSPENAADASKPVGIVLTCGIFGSLLGGAAAGPTGAATGFAGGSVFGQMITKHLKPGAAADKLQDLLQEDDEPQAKD